MSYYPRILIVEDEVVIAMDIQHTLECLGFEVCGVVSSGKDSIEKASQTQPDLILMDIGLKGPIDGISAARVIQSHLSIPVIYLTAYGDEGTLKRVDQTKPFGYIHKPFEEGELHFIIEAALNN